MWRRKTANRGRESEPRLYRADIPVMGELILDKLKTETLAPALTECDRELRAIDVLTVFDSLRQIVAERKLARVQHEYAAAAFITNGSVNYNRLVTSDQESLIRTANRLIYDALSPCGSSEITGEELAQNSMIRLYPLETPPPPADVSLSA